MADGRWPKSVAATAEVQYSVHDYKLNAATTNNDEKSIENPKTKATTTTTNDERRTTNDDNDEDLSLFQEIGRRL